MLKITALAGGVGGAKLADGLAAGEVELTVVVNTGDDFEHFGLWISPDLDTVCYNLAGMENPKNGWGRREESWETLNEIRTLGGPDWFQLGNRDLATHLERTRRLRAGERLSEITAKFCQAWGVETQVLPMSDDPIPTMVATDQGEIPFQDYFVRLRCEPEVTGFRFSGVDAARPTPGLLAEIGASDLIVLCPSNPWVSIDPILTVPGIRSALLDKPVLAISPIIGGQAVKGPAAKMYREMGLVPSAAAVAGHYGELLDGFVIDEEDQALGAQIQEQSRHPLQVFVTDTWMSHRRERIRTAQAVIKFGLQMIKED